MSAAILYLVYLSCKSQFLPMCETKWSLEKRSGVFTEFGMENQTLLTYLGMIINVNRNRHKVIEKLGTWFS